MGQESRKDLSWGFGFGLKHSGQDGVISDVQGILLIFFKKVFYFSMICLQGYVVILIVCSFWGVVRDKVSLFLEPVLELTPLTKFALNSQRSSCLCPPSAGIKDMYHSHHLALFAYF